MYRDVSLDILIDAFKISRINVSEEDLIQFFNYLCDVNDDFVKFWDLWGLLLPNLSEDGTKISNYLWSSLNPGKSPEIPLSKMKNRFFGKFDPDVQTRKKQERDIENKFIRNLDTYCQVGMIGGGNIDKREFDGFMKCWAFSCENERDFLMRLVECFRLNKYSDKYGIHGSIGNSNNKGWRKEWDTGRSGSNRHGRRGEDIEEKKSTWGNFTEGKDEIYHSRRGRSAYGRDRFERK